jgi:hypothetical protein
MKNTLRVRFWIEAGLAAATGLMAAITPFFPDWIEFISGWDPDRHDGSVERLMVVGLFCAFLFASGLAALEWRRPRFIG